ncbi:phage tail protein [Lacticaseibacillus nasuensis]|uniref:phage tail protein n=1 Tax=Lacticaseibacillus nasuensis TaxID=944671 RepID=UPI0022468193|nr:hypothetical protein [Lacticaseibacillus nasuensis]MCX2455618.1 hypothetical protein [Lacticaseibacillus nasuensis]
MEFYFTDRMRQLIATVSTDETDGLMMDGDTETQSLVAGSRTLEGVVHYNADQIDLAKAACAGGNLILYKGRDSEAVVTEIMHVEHSALDMTYTITADSAGVDLLDETVDKYAADDEHDIEFYLTKFIWDSGWTIRKNEVDKSYLKLSWDSDDETALARVLDVADKFGAELDFGFTMGSDGTFEKYIDVYQKRGTATDDELVRDVNINNITTTVDLYDMFTSVKAKADVQDAKGAPITLKGLSYESDDGRYVLGSDGVLRDTVAVQDWSRILSVSNPDPTVHHLQRVKTYSTGITTLAEDSPTIKQYPQKITAKQKDIASLQKRIKATNGYIAKQKTYITNKNKYISECNARIAKYTAKITDLQNGEQEKTTASQIANQKKYIVSQQGYIANANKSIKGYNTKINEYYSDIKKYNAQIDTDNADIKTMEAGKDLLLSQVQSKLLDMALEDLKAHCEPTMTYEVDIAKLPDGVRIGDTLHIVDDAENQYLNARVLELQYSYSMKTGTATLGDYFEEQSELNVDLVDLAAGVQRAQEAANAAKEANKVTFVQSTTEPDTTTLATGAVWEKPAVVADDGTITAAAARQSWDGAGWSDSPVASAQVATVLSDKNIVGSTIENTDGTFRVDPDGTINGAMIILTPSIQDGNTYEGAMTAADGVIYEVTRANGEQSFVSTNWSSVQAQHVALDGTSTVAGLDSDTGTVQVMNLDKGLNTVSSMVIDGESMTALKGDSHMTMGLDSGLYSVHVNSDKSKNVYGLGPLGLELQSISADNEVTSGVLDAWGLSRLNSIGTKLWSGAWAMADTTTLTLPKKISQCLNGIVLLWGTGKTDAPVASDYTMTFIPKWFAADHSGRGIDCIVGNAGKNTFGIKYIYVTDTTLKGYDNNISNLAASKVLQGVYEY